MSLLWEISGSGPLGRGLASQQVCCATLPDCRPAFCSVITYRLEAEEADGRDVNTHTQKKKTDPNNTSSRHRRKQRGAVDVRGNATDHSELFWNLTSLLLVQEWSWQGEMVGQNRRRTWAWRNNGSLLEIMSVFVSAYSKTSHLLPRGSTKKEKKKKSLMLSHWNASLPDQEGERNHESPP